MFAFTMFLYTTILTIKNQPVRYEVSSQQDNKFLLYKPELPVTKTADLPIFWVTRQEGKWAPVNVKDKSLVNQVLADIKEHQIEE